MGNEKIKLRIVYAFLSIVIATSLFLPVRTMIAQTQSYIVNFGGYMVNVDYMTCNCGFIIFTVYDNATKVEYRIIYFYLLQLLEKLGIDFGTWLSMFIPRIYAQYAIWEGSNANVLGNFIRYQGASCLVISGTWCTVESGVGDGYLWNMGTSFIGTN